MSGPAVPAPTLQSGRWSRRAHRRLARHADAAPVRWARAAAERAVALLHSENHDMATNGELALVRRLAPHLRVVVDVGANRGDWTAGVLTASPAARLLCAELVTPTRDRLRARFAAHPRVTVLHTGLGDGDETVTVRCYADDDRWSSVVDYPHRAAKVLRHERVRRGDDVLAEHGVDHVDLLKVDAEGADLAVLRGFARSLRQGHVDVVQFEYGFACVLARAFLLDFYELLEGAGFAVGRLGPRGVDFTPYRFELETFFGPNFVAVRRDRPDLGCRVAAPGARWP